MMCRLSLSGFGFILLMCFGCVSSHPVVLPPPVITGKPDAVDVIVVTTTNSIPGVEGETRILHDTLVSSLRETGIFIEVPGDTITNTAASGLKVSAGIIRLNKVSANARDWFGGVAGDAQVVVQVKVSDLATGRVLEEFQAYGHTGTSPGAGTTYVAIEAAAANAVSQITALCAKAAQ